MSPEGEQLPTLPILIEHHKDSFRVIREWEKRRDRTFIFVAILLALLQLMAHYPEAGLELVATELAPKPTKVLSELPMPVVMSLVWTLLFAMVLRYCQSSISVDRKYQYLHLVERRMGLLVGDKELFQREGAAYLNEYPAFSWWAYAFYSAIFPIGIAIVSLEAMHVECTSDGASFFLYFDGAMWLGTLISVFLYRVVPLFARKSKPKEPNQPLQRTSR